MPDPVSSASSAAVSEPQLITLDPVVIEGRPPRAVPSCERERDAAALGCSLGAAALVVSALGKTSILGMTGALLSAVKEATSCSKLITAYDQCKEQGAARIAAANRCEADGGVAVAGVEKDEVVCLEQP